MGTWRTLNQLISDVELGPVGYGCVALDQYRVFTTADQIRSAIPSQSTIDADEAACIAASSGQTAGGVTASQVTAIATSIAVNQREQVTAELTPVVDAAQQTADAALATAQDVQRATTAPIPTAVYTQPYTLLNDDQRTIHLSATADVATPPSAASAKNRRLVFDNAGPGTATVSGSFISPRPDGSWMWTNPVIVAGGAMEAISQFIPGLGTDPSPDDLRVNGVPADPGTVGGWTWSIVSVNNGGPSAGDFATYQASVTSSLAGKQPSGSYAPLVGGLVPSANLPPYPTVPVQSVNGQTGTVVLSIPTMPVQSVAGKTGTVTLATSDVTGLDAALAAKEPAITAGTTGQYWRGDKTFQTLPVAPVTSVNAKTGVVTLVASDVGAAATVHTHAIADVTALQAGLDAKAPLASPALTGTPTAPTATAGTTSPQLATTAFVTSAVAAIPASPVTSVAGRTGVITLAIADVSSLQGSLDAKAPLASPALTGTPVGPTASAGTSTTQLATTAFVRGEVAALVNSAPGTLDTLGEIATQLASDESTAAALATTVGTKAPLASPAFTGTPTVPTPGAGTNTTQAASTAFVTGAIATAVPAKSFTQPAASRTIQTIAAAANGWQISATRDAFVCYSVTVSTSVNVVSLQANEGYVTLEVCSTNSTSAAAWLECGRVTNGQNVSLAIALALTQKNGAPVTGMVPAGWYVRLRSVNTSGTPTYAVTAGQEVVL